MTLSELLRRKMTDYGYDSVREFSRALGIPEERLSEMMQSLNAYPEMAERQAICRVLDVDPGVLRAMMDRPGLKKYELETLIAFKRHGMRTQETARALYVHISTVRYRLNCIRDRTGFDPREPEGLRVLLLGGVIVNDHE